MTLEAGTEVTFDGRIFHRAGLDGNHHVEEDIEAFVDPVTAEGSTRTLLLKEEERERLGESYASLLDGMTVDAEDPGLNEKIDQIKKIGGFVFDGGDDE